MTEPLPDTDVRASDAERDNVAEALQGHYTAGRLTVAELDERVAAAYAAITRAQLAALLADLPAEPTEQTDQPTTDTTPVAGGVANPILLWVLVGVCPPVGLFYWLCTRRAMRGIDPILLCVLVGLAAYWLLNH